MSNQRFGDHFLGHFVTPERAEEGLCAQSHDNGSSRDASNSVDDRFLALARSASDAIVSANADDRITFWNPAAEAIFGYSEQEAIGKPVVMLIPDDLKQSHSEGLRRYLDTGNPRLIGSRAELRALHKDGSEFPIELSLSTWSIHGERRFSAIIRDITERKEAERKLEQTTAQVRTHNEELQALLQMVAHDLKSPVITIAGLVRQLQKKIPEEHRDQKLQTILESIAASSKTMESFLKDLLDELSYEQTGPEIAPTDLETAVRSAISDHQGTIDNAGAKVEIDAEDDLPNASCDERRIRHVLNNLITNAISYRDPDRRLRIRFALHRRRDEIHVEVSDNGVGVPEEYRDKVFDRFVRVRREGGPSGTGLGLAITKAVIEGHGGEVWLESEEGTGSTFGFSLPIADE